MSQPKIDAFKALRLEQATLIAESAELRNTRLPALQTRANTAQIAVDQAKQTLSQTYDDAAFATAKQALEAKKGELRDAQLMASNVDTRINQLRNSAIPEVTRKLESVQRDMWKDKYDEVIATLPPLSAESLLIVEKLDSILRQIDSHTHRLGIGYGQPITDKQGKPTQQTIEAADVLLRAEMGI